MPQLICGVLMKEVRYSDLHLRGFFPECPGSARIQFVRIDVRDVTSSADRFSIILQKASYVAGRRDLLRPSESGADVRSGLEDSWAFQAELFCSLVLKHAAKCVKA